MLFIPNSNKISSINFAYDYKNNQIIELEHIFQNEIIINGVVIETQEKALSLYNYKKNKNKISLEDEKKLKENCSK